MLLIINVSVVFFGLNNDVFKCIHVQYVNTV